MISFFYEIDIERLDEEVLTTWINTVVLSENKTLGEVNYIFCDDEYLLEINQKFLNHDTYTDIISFDNSIGNELHGDIFISHERVLDNAKKYKVTTDNELKRVMVHGMLHFCGYKDKSEEEAQIMRQKENEKLLLFHVEQ